MSENQAKTEDAMLPGKIIYGLYGAGFIFGLTAIAGVIFAYIRDCEGLKKRCIKEDPFRGSSTAACQPFAKVGFRTVSNSKFTNSMFNLG